MGSPLRRRNFQISRRIRKDKKDTKDSSPSHAVMCNECKGHWHVKRECPTYLKAKGKVFATTLSDLDSSNLDSKESCDSEGNYSAFMTIAPVETTPI